MDSVPRHDTSDSNTGPVCGPKLMLLLEIVVAPTKSIIKNQILQTMHSTRNSTVRLNFADLGSSIFIILLLSISIKCG